MSSSDSKIAVDIAIPAYNEKLVLKQSIRKLLSFIQGGALDDYRVRLIIVDNASTDTTSEIGKKLAEKYDNLDYLRLKNKGRGRALRFCWKQSRAQILAYMDVDLSAQLEFLKPLFTAVAKSEADIAIGSRLKKGAQVSGRTFTREMMSRVYNLLISLFFHTSFQDAQCGFKAIRNEAFHKLEPLIQNQNWFFDSEMLINAEKAGMRIKEIPISWKDDPSSTVRIATTAFEDLQGLRRLRKEKPWEKLVNQ